MPFGIADVKTPRRGSGSGSSPAVNPLPDWISRSTAPSVIGRRVGPGLYRLGTNKLGVSGSGALTGKAVTGAIKAEAARRVIVSSTALTAPVPQVRIAAGTAVNESAVLNQVKGGSLSPVLGGQVTSPDVVMSGLRIRLWSRDKDGPLDQFLKSNQFTVKQIEKLTVGRYIFGFKVPHEYTAPFVSFDKGFPVKVLGKTVMIEKGRIDQAAGRMEVQLNILENPIPIMAIVLGIGGALAAGFLSFGLSDMFDSVDKVVLDLPGSVWKIALVAGVGYVLYRFVL